MYVNTTADVKALSDYCCTSANAVEVVRHIYATHGPDTEILFGPDMWLGAYVEKVLGRRMHVWDGECHVHAGIRPADLEATRASHPGADLLVHPECGCSTSVMEYVAAGDVSDEGVHILSTGGMLAHAHAVEQGEGDGDGAGAGAPREAVVATEVGMLYPLQMAAPQVRFIPANAEASCRFMKMITLPKLRDSLREHALRGAGPGGPRRARPRADRPHGRDRLAPGGRRPQNSSAVWGPTQATASSSPMPWAISATSSKVTASSAAIAASGSVLSPKTICWVAP